MRRSKRQKLEKKGWRVGSAQEFLGLSEQEAAYVELRVRLADSLKARRQEQNLTQTAFARRIPSRSLSE
jgi:hypothetical protein